MASHITFADGTLMKVTSEGILYGISFVLSVQAIASLIRRSKSRTNGLNRVMFYSTIALFFLSTWHIITDIQYLREGFSLSPLGPTAYFDLITTPVKAAEQASRITAVSLADALTIYRLWGVWGGKKSIVIFPLITLVGTIACAVAFVTDQNLIKQRPGASIFTPSVEDLTVAFLACSLATTWYCTGFIAWKLHQLMQKTKQLSSMSSVSEKWAHLLRILVESAALYSGINFIYMVLYLCKTNAEAMPSAWEVPVASITFSLIVIRVDLMVARLDPSPSNRPTDPPTSIGRSEPFIVLSPSSGQYANKGDIPLKDYPYGSEQV